MGKGRYFATICATASLISGCSAGFVRSQPSKPGVNTGFSAVTIRGDWSDVEAAVDVSVTRAEVAVTATTFEASRMKFVLVTATDELGELVALREDASGNGENVPIRLEAHFGRFGDAPREVRLLEAVAKRLEQLRGRDVAPISW